MTKKVILLFIGLVMTMSVAAQQMRFGGIIDDKDGYVNVRQSMSTKSAVVTRLANWTDVYFTPLDGNWFHVARSANGQYIGYVYNDRITLPDACYFIVTDADGYTNMREKPTTQSKVVRKLRHGQSIYCTEAYINGKYTGWMGVFDKGYGAKKLLGFVHETKVTVGEN